MSEAVMLTKVKNALGITSTDTRITSEIEDLIAAARADLKGAGILMTEVDHDPLITQAIKTYCRANFRSPADADRLKASYDEQKGTLMNSTHYTNWRDGHGAC